MNICAALGARSIWHGARVGSLKSNTPINLIVRQYAHHKVMFWYFSTYDKL
jgi:hypothetical protein